jgi:methylmalonyl-CoA mutase cobalamin-binding domain/chain
MGEVGRVGVAIDSLEDMEVLLEGIPLDQVSTSMTINATAAILLALYVAVARRRGIREDALSGTVQNDILKEYVARGTYIYPPGPSLRLVTDVIAYCAEQVPRWNPISISGYHIREAGATAARRSASPSRTPSNTCARPAPPLSIPASSASASRSSSPAIPISWRKWRSSGPPAVSGRAS